MVTPQQKDLVKQVNNRKQPINSFNRIDVQQGEPSQRKSIDSNILERVLPVPIQTTNSRKGGEETEKKFK